MCSAGGAQQAPRVTLSSEVQCLCVLRVGAVEPVKEESRAVQEATEGRRAGSGTRASGRQVPDQQRVASRQAEPSLTGIIRLWAGKDVGAGANTIGTGHGSGVEEQRAGSQQSTVSGRAFGALIHPPKRWEQGELD